MSDPMPPPTLTVLTLSFAGDAERCRVLCETADRFLDPAVEHVLAVPAADLRLFSAFGGGRRRLVAQEELIPRWLVKLPLPASPAWRRRLFLPRRNVYLSLRGRPVRGWIAQQMMKLAAAAAVGSDVVLHCDSDTALIRPVGPRSVLLDGAVRLLRVPDACDTARHAVWHETAARLLRLPETGYQGADYIDQFVTWRRANVERLLAHLATVGGRDPAAILAGTSDFSEYILYGAFCDKVLGLAAAGHAETPTSLCATVWSQVTGGEAGLSPAAIAPHHLGIGIQSTIAIPPERYRAMVADAIATASAQDTAGRGAVR